MSQSCKNFILQLSLGQLITIKYMLVYYIVHHWFDLISTCTLILNLDKNWDIGSKSEASNITNAQIFFSLPFVSPKPSSYGAIPIHVIKSSRYLIPNSTAKNVKKTPHLLASAS